MWHIAAKFVSRLLSSDQKEYHNAVCNELKEMTPTLSPPSLVATNLGFLDTTLR
jgi:CRISPR/Cas system-associated protein Csx1